MIIKWLGHASFLITLEDGTKIITDPYETGFHESFKYSPIQEIADIVTISHEHGDHNAVDELPGNPEVVRGVGIHHVRGIRFTGIEAYHDKSKGAERGPNTIFCFTVDGLNICHLGDLGHTLKDDQLAALGEIDILFIPTGGPMATLPLEEVEATYRQINPKIVIPMHFRNDRCTFPPHGIEDFIAGRKNIKRENMSDVEINKKDLPVSTQIIVLEPAL